MREATSQFFAVLGPLSMSSSIRRNRGPFLFAQIVRARIVEYVDENVWKLSNRDASLTIYSKAFDQQVSQSLGSSFPTKAQFWVGREESGSPRVSFEFFPKSQDYETLHTLLAAGFREFISGREPSYCLISSGATVLRAVVDLPSDATEIPSTEIEKAIGLFNFVSDNLDEWRRERLHSLLQAVQQPLDPLYELETYKGSFCDLPATEREEIRKSRIGQGIFRNRLIQYWDACAVSGMSVKSVLRASHIKPWRVSNNHERLDHFNGLLLAPNLDALFDTGLISFSNEGKIVTSPKLTIEDRDLLSINDDLSLRFIEEPHRQYLGFHRRLFGFEPIP